MTTYLTRAVLIIALAISLAVACYGEHPERKAIPLVVKEITNPARQSSAFPNLTVTGNGSVLMSWLEPSGNRAKRLRFAVRQENGWTATRPVTLSRGFNKHPAVLPVVTVLTETSFVACWTQTMKVAPHTEYLFASASRNGGKSWTKPVIVHQDRSESEHSLISVAPLDNDKVVIVWLDGREEARSERSMLLQATFDTRGGLGTETTLDPDVCSCCPTAIAHTSDGLVVAYRDRTQGNIRDISVVRFKDGRWGEPSLLNQDGWQINGCPTNGVDVAADQSRVAVAWFTAANDTARLKISFSNNGGESFTAPVQVDEGHPVGRASVALLANGIALVSWVERADSKARLMIRGVAPDGRVGAAVVAASETVAGIGYPRIRQAGNHAIIAWADAQDAKKVRTAIVSIEQ